VLRAGGMQTSEKTYRLYSCRRCIQQVRICAQCDRGNRYCAGECATIRRRESLRRAGERYQLSHRGACRHAARQSAWRSRQAQKVTHQGSLPGAIPVIVAAIPIQTTTGHVDIASIQPPPSSRPGAARSTAQPHALGRSGYGHVHPVARAHNCSFCWRVLPAFARWGPLRGGP
jgi:hypothetical protein